jgi:hypothetical protein
VETGAGDPGGGGNGLSPDAVLRTTQSVLELEGYKAAGSGGPQDNPVLAVSVTGS